ALPLAAGELARHARHQRVDIEDSRRMVDAPADLGPGDAAIAQRERHVLEHRHMRIERIILEHHGDVAILGIEFVDDPAVDPDLARRDVLEAGDHAQQGALAAARGANEDDELAVGDFEVDAVHDRDLTERLADPVETDPGHASPSAVTPAGTIARTLSTVAAAKPKVWRSPGIPRHTRPT